MSSSPTYASELSSKEAFSMSCQKYRKYGVAAQGFAFGIFCRGMYLFRSVTADYSSRSRRVDMVIIPVTSGQLGIRPRHVATIAELKPGVLSLHDGTGITKYFISSGFAFIHPNSYADIIAVEAVPADIDAAAVLKGLAYFNQKLSSATSNLEKAKAQKMPRSPDSSYSSTRTILENIPLKSE